LQDSHVDSHLKNFTVVRTCDAPYTEGINVIRPFTQEFVELVRIGHAVNARGRSE